MEEPQDDAEQGLGMGLRPTARLSGASQGTPNLESFLRELQERILDMAWNYRNNHEIDETSDKIHNIRKELRANHNVVVVQTDKTNSFMTFPTDEYIKQVMKHLKEHGKPISHLDLQKVRTQADGMIRQVQPHLNKKEVGFLRQYLDSYDIPTPKLLIKDHKPMINGVYPTRLIVPASNFMAAFSKLGYLGLKQIFEDNQIDYAPHGIEQATQLKAKMEKLHLTPENCTIVSIDAKDYYPSTRFRLVEMAVNKFSKNLPAVTQQKIKVCLRMIKFGIQHTFLVFKDKYYEYDGGQDPMEKGLTIGGHASGWLSDVSGGNIMDEAEECFSAAICRAVFRDDWIMILQG